MDNCVIVYSIVFPAGILQGRFFSADRPAYLNYGAIGFVIGHEITHGFDTKGRQFDGLGNVHTWWQSETLDRFLAKTECVEYQFGNYTEPLTNLKVRETFAYLSLNVNTNSNCIGSIHS